MDKTTNKLEELIKKAASRYARMPIAISGGIDSGLLAALIKPKFAINVELPGGDKYNESEYARIVARHLGITLHVVKLDNSKFDEVIEKAVRIIGKPVSHFNIFPLFEMYQVLRDIFKEEDLVLGDGPDESMCGYTRHLIMNYLFDIYNFEAFEHYRPVIDELIEPTKYYKMIGHDVPNTGFVSLNDLTSWMCEIDMKLKRPEMDTMSNKLAKHFGIKNHRPYQDNKEVDEFMFNFPPELKIHKVEYGKYALRLIAEKYLPKEIVWRKQKVGGPVYPVNKVKGWDKTEGEFGKRKWLKWQKQILSA